MSPDPKMIGIKGNAVAAAMAFVVIVTTLEGCSNQPTPNEEARAENVEMPAEDAFVGQNSAVASPSSRYDDMARSAGVDPKSYADSASELGLKPNEMLATELVVCRDIKDCPAGMTPESARRTICEKIGDC